MIGANNNVSTGNDQKIDNLLREIVQAFIDRGWMNPNVVTYNWDYETYLRQTLRDKVKATMLEVFLSSVHMETPK